jgi:hypothetical protein
VSGVSADWWWENVHSGSAAIEIARELLEKPHVLGSYDRTLEVMLVCSELIFRITGERVIPATAGFDGQNITGVGMFGEIPLIEAQD